MAITASMVKELREMTGAGMMDCKKALTATEGDMDKAVDFLREKGLAGAQKKAGRIAAEGIVATCISEDEKHAVVVEVNAETDFVAKNEKFKTYVAEVAAQAVNTQAEDIEGFMAEKWALDPSMTVKEKLSSMISIIGENMNIRRFAKVSEENGIVVSYIHAGGSIGVMVKFDTDVADKEGFAEYGKDVAMQVAAANPSYLTEAEVPAEVLEKEKEILKVQAINEGKPEAIAEKMVQGRIKKFYKENCLIDQEFIKDGDQTIKSYTDAKAKELGGKIEIVSFVRFEKGEGIEKRADDFASEVASMMK